MLTTIFSDDFGGSHPGAWTIAHDGGGGTYAWAWPTGFAHCYADPSGSLQWYPDNLHVYMQRQNVSLAGYSSASLSFDYAVDSEATWDYLTVNLRDQSGNWHELWRQSGPTDPLTWSNKAISLDAYAGQSGLYVQFRFDSDGSTSGSPYDGAYVDNVVLTATGAASYGFATERVSVAAGGVQGNNNSGLASISSNGRYVAFSSDATNLVAGDTNNADDVFVYDRQTDSIQRVSVGAGGVQARGEAPSISGDGRYVAYASDASNLVSGDTNNAWDAFLYDRQTGQVERVSVASDESQGGNATYNPVLTSDARYVAFESSSDFVANDVNYTFDIFVRDRQTGTTERVSMTAAGNSGNDSSYDPSISDDGRYVAFESRATDLVSGDTNSRFDVFVYDRQTDTTRRVSVSAGGAQGNDDSYDPSISADGRYVAFSSRASNLVSGDTNGTSDIFVYDLQTNSIQRAPAGVNGTLYSYAPSISADGRYVAFESSATNLVSGDTNDKSDIFVYDRQAGVTRRVSVSSSGAQANLGSNRPALSADGAYVAFESIATNLVAGDTNNYQDVFVSVATAGSNGTVGIFNPSASGFYLRNSHSAGTADVTFGYGPGGAGWQPLAGDWNGDGVDTIGLYNPSTGVFYLRNSNSAGSADVAFGYGPGGQGWKPLAGDWNGDGADTVGLYNPSTGVFYLRNSNSPGSADVAFGYGPGGQGWLPLAGDWNGNVADTIGVYNPSTGVFYLRNSNSAGNADVAFGYGPGGSGWQPMAADWNGDGADTVGAYNPSGGTFFLRNSNTSGAADTAFAYGPAGLGWQPLTGDWDGAAGAGLRAADGIPLAGDDATPLTDAALAPIVAQAIADWADLGLADEQLDALTRVRFVVTDLPGSLLGWAGADAIYLDSDAAGYGWFVDPTPDAAEEFAALDARAVDRMDLLTVVSHELGHSLGLDDLDASSDGIMSGVLGTGTRREPGVAEIDAVFAGISPR